MQKAMCGYGHVTVLKFCRLSWCSASGGFVSDSWATCSIGITIGDLKWPLLSLYPLRPFNRTGPNSDILLYGPIHSFTYSHSIKQHKLCTQWCRRKFM